MTKHSYYDFFFFFNDTATTEIYTLSLHDALPICRLENAVGPRRPDRHHERTVPEDLGRRHHGSRPAPRAQDVGGLRVAVHPLQDDVQHDPRARHGEARAERLA